MTDRLLTDEYDRLTTPQLPEPDFNLMDYVLTTTGFGGPPVKDADKYRAADHAKWHREHPARPCERDSA